MKEQRLEALFNRYIQKAATKKEERELLTLLNDPALSEKSKALIDAVYDRPPAACNMTDEQAENVYKNILPHIIRPTVRKLYLKRWVVAASVLLIVGAGSYFFFSDRTGTPPETVQTALPHDVRPPETNKATVTLADGSVVYLDSAGSGQLATQGHIQLVKTENGKIEYNGQLATGSQPLIYNTLRNPKGSKVIDMTLTDGSRVWLNAGSSITYPVVFTGNERKVTMTGEAYFEIAPLSFRRGSRSLSGRGEAKEPFIVQKGDMQVTVLGTHFNVNAYDDENDIKVTLLEGAVKVSLPSPSGEGPDRYREGVRPEVKLKPGQQASINNPIAIGSSSDSNRIIIHNSADLDQVMAWKNGRFSFYKADIQTVMRQLARWYDLDVEYSGEVTKDLFWGDIQRDLPLSQVLDFLKKSQVHFIVEGKKVMVMK